MTTFQDMLAQWPRERRAEIAARATEAQVLAALEKDTLRPEDFLVLLSPAAEPLLERMAQRAHALTLRYFGRAVNLFTPLYVSDYCTNQCRYCGFNANNHLHRRHLSVDEAEAEARVIASMRLQHILLLTGDARQISSPQYIADVARRIKPLFASVGIEVYSMTEEEYAEFAERLSAYNMSQAEFIRQAITGAAIRPIITVSPVNDELLAAVGKLTAEYGRIGGNLNQIARTLNEWHSPYPQLAGEVRAAVSDLAALKFEVLQKVGDAVGNIQTYQL